MQKKDYKNASSTMVPHKDVPLRGTKRELSIELSSKQQQIPNLDINVSNKCSGTIIISNNEKREDLKGLENRQKALGSSREIIGGLQIPNYQRNPSAPSKSQRIEELRKKMGVQPTQKESKSGKQHKEGILKVGFEKLGKCCREMWAKIQLKCTRTKKKSQPKKKNVSGNGEESQNINAKKRSNFFPSSNELNNVSDLDETVGGSSTKEGINSSASHSTFKRGMKRRGGVTGQLGEQFKIQLEMEAMRNTINQMNHEKIMEKGYRHLIDALLYRTVRHDLDGTTNLHKLTLFTWRIQNSSLWNDFLLFLGWVYILMSFFEPANRNEPSLDPDSFEIMIGIEVFILVLQNIDLVMELIQRSTQENASILLVLITRKKNFFRLIFFLLNSSDLIYYATSYPVNTFRFARVIRPLQIIIFSKSLRRNFQGIINSAKNLLMILFFYVIICFLWGYIGVNMVGDVYNDDKADTFAVDFRDIFKATNAMYIFSSLDLYPDILFPAIQNSSLYLLYFVPYLVLFLLLFAPIPVAVVYEGFRKHRLNILVVDRIKRRKALFACFQCIVSDNKISYIKKQDFIQFFQFVYSKVEQPESSETIAEVLWSEMDANENNKVGIEEFFEIIDLTEQRHEFRLQRIKPFKWWIRFRQIVQEKINLETKLQSSTFDLISILVTLGSCSITLYGLFGDDQSSTFGILDYIDYFFFAFFCSEILLKMIAYGVSAFFNESWNNFDLSLVVFQAFFDYVFYSFLKGSNMKSFSASRVLKIAKLQKIFRMFRAFRTVKILRYVLSGLDLIHKVYEMLYKIVICVPIVMKLSVICVIVFYIYAAIGVELFSSNLFPTEQQSPYGQQMCNPDLQQQFYNGCEYATFDTFGGATLILLQVCVGSGWGYLQFDYSKKYDVMTLSTFYFNSFHFLSVFVLALIGGLVWEVFDVVERIMRDQQIYQEQVELQQQWEEQQQLLEQSFQSSDTQKKNGFKKSSSLKPSIAAAVALMKLPMFSQKFHLSHPKEQDEEEDEDDIQQEPENKQLKTDEHQPNSEAKNIKKVNSKIANRFSNLVIQAHTLKPTTQNNTQENENCLSQNKSSEPLEGNEDIGQENENDDEDDDDNDDDFQDSEDECSSYENEEEEQGGNKTNSFFHTTTNKITTESDVKKGLLNGNMFQESDFQDMKAKEYQERLNTNDEKKSLNQNSMLAGEEQNSIKKKKRKTKKKKKQKIHIMKAKCNLDNPLLSQRDRSQLILYQDIFQMSTLDVFFENRTLVVPIEDKKDESFRNNKETNSNKDLFAPDLNGGGSEKTAQFDVIREEDEENYDNNKSPLWSSGRQKFLLKKSPTGKEFQTKENSLNKFMNPTKQFTLFSPKTLSENKIESDQIQNNVIENQAEQFKEFKYFSKENKEKKDFKNLNENKIANDNFKSILEGIKSIGSPTKTAIAKQKDSIGQQNMICEESLPTFPTIKRENYVDSIDQDVLLQSPPAIDSQEERGDAYQRKKAIEKLKNVSIKRSHSLEDSNRKGILSSGQLDDPSFIRPHRGSEFLSASANNDTNGIFLKDFSSDQTLDKGEDLSFKKYLKAKKNFAYDQSEYSPISLASQKKKIILPQNSSFLALEKRSQTLPLATKSLKKENEILLFQKSKTVKDNEKLSIPPPIPLPLADLSQMNLKKVVPKDKNNKKYKSNDLGRSDLMLQFKQQGSSKSKSSQMKGANNFTELAYQQKPILFVTENSYISDDHGLSERMNFPFSENIAIENQSHLESNRGLMKTQSKYVSNHDLFQFKSEENLELGLIRNDLSVQDSQRKTEKQSSKFKQRDEPFSQHEEGKEDCFQNLERSFMEDLAEIQVDLGQVNLNQSKPMSKKEEKQKKKLLKEKRIEKKRAELEYFYQKNLLEVEDSIPSSQLFSAGKVQTQSQTNHNSQAGIPKSKTFELRVDKREIIKDAPKNEMLKNQLININQDLRNQQQFQIKIDLNNMNFIINKAILKQVNLEKIHNIEMRHFRHMYGSAFQDMLDNEIFPLWNRQAKLLFHFDNMLKYDYTPVEQFVQLYSGIEMQISSLLMNKFSSFKMIFQDQDNSWFTINYSNEAYFLHEVEKEGPWEFFESLFEKSNPKKLIKHRNIYSAPEQSKHTKKKLQKFFQVSQDISNNYFFRKLQINQKRSDIIYIPFINDDPTGTQSKSIEVFQNSTSFLPEYILKEDLKLDWMPKIKKGLAIAHLFDNPLVKDRKRNFNSKIINIEEAIIEEDVLKKEQSNATLNYTYSIEFIKDLKSHILSHKEQLFLKISQFYFYRSCFEKNFCHIQEEPFENNMSD